MSLSQSMTSLQSWCSMQSIVSAALNTNPRVFVTYNSGSLSVCNCLLAECIGCNVPELA